MDWHNFLLFALASLMLNLTPGADMLYVATRSSTQGVKAGMVSALGITAGCLVHLAAAAVGLSALIAESAVLFSVLKYLGAAYLVYLGGKAFFSRRSAFVIPVGQPGLGWGSLFKQGLLTNVLNPKVALFFLAFLPQFVLPGQGPAFAQILLLGAWFNFSGTVVNFLVALLFGKLGNWLAGKQWFVRGQNRVTGLLLIGLGFRIALGSKK